MKGGKRCGAGRPRKGRERKICITFSVEPRLISLMDEKLDGGSRSELVENLLKRFLKIED